MVGGWRVAWVYCSRLQGPFPWTLSLQSRWCPSASHYSGGGDMLIKDDHPLCSAFRRLGGGGVTYAGVWPSAQTRRHPCPVPPSSPLSASSRSCMAAVFVRCLSHVVPNFCSRPARTASAGAQQRWGQGAGKGAKGRAGAEAGTLAQTRVPVREGWEADVRYALDGAAVHGLIGDPLADGAAHELEGHLLPLYRQVAWVCGSSRAAGQGAPRAGGSLPAPLNHPHVPLEADAIGGIRGRERKRVHGRVGVRCTPLPPTPHPRGDGPHNSHLNSSIPN